MTENERSIYRAALIGFKAQLTKTLGHIKEIEEVLGADEPMWKPLWPANANTASSGQTQISPAMLADEALPAYRKLKAVSFHNAGTGILSQPRKKHRKKHRMTPAGRARLSAAMKNRWREKKAKAA